MLLPLVLLAVYVSIVVLALSLAAAAKRGDAVEYAEEPSTAAGSSPSALALCPSCMRVVPAERTGALCEACAAVPAGVPSPGGYATSPS
jgi:hypothetical protein